VGIVNVLPAADSGPFSIDRTALGMWCHLINLVHNESFNIEAMMTMHRPLFKSQGVVGSSRLSGAVIPMAILRQANEWICVLSSYLLDVAHAWVREECECGTFNACHPRRHGKVLFR